jgi:tetratricopeptide (TPR) repeat protein
LLQQAIALDPQQASFHAALADCYDVIFIYAPAQAHNPLQQARSEAQRALALDPASAEAHAALAYSYFYDWQFPAAEAEFKKSIDLNPRYATAHQWYGEYLRMMGRQDEAIAESKLALESDPLSAIINVEAALPYYYQGDYAKAAAQLQRTLELDPYFASTHGHLARVYALEGKLDDALRECLAARQLDDAPWIRAEQGMILARLGRKAEAEKIGRDLRAVDSHALQAMVEISLGNREHAIKLLELGCDQHDPMMVGLRVEPSFRALYTDPRFPAMLSRIGFST